jgi:hypothetical protein
VYQSVWVGLLRSTSGIGNACAKKTAWEVNLPCHNATVALVYENRATLHAVVCMQEVADGESGLQHVASASCWIKMVTRLREEHRSTHLEQCNLFHTSIKKHIIVGSFESRVTFDRELLRVQELDSVLEVFAKGHEESRPMLGGVSTLVRSVFQASHQIRYATTSVPHGCLRNTFAYVVSLLFVNCSTD